MRPPVVSQEIPFFDITCFIQALAENSNVARIASGGGAAKESKDWDLRLLRPRGERPNRCRSTESEDDLAPPSVEHRASSRLAPPASLPHAQPAAEGPASPWGRSGSLCIEA